VPSARRDNGGTIRVVFRERSTACRTVSTPGSPDQISPGDGELRNGANTGPTTRTRSRPATRRLPVAIHSFHSFIHSASQQFPQVLGVTDALTVDNTAASRCIDGQPRATLSEIACRANYPSWPSGPLSVRALGSQRDLKNPRESTWRGAPPRPPPRPRYPLASVAEFSKRHAKGLRSRTR
jgi:hypothetical protein